MVTPFQETGEVDYEEANRLASYLVEHGTDTLVICGTTGESPTLTWDEEYTLFQTVQEAVAGRAKVIAGTGSNSTREAVLATEKAARLGVDGSLQVVPYYNKPSQAGLYHHFKAIADCSSLPILLYNVPGRTATQLLPETIAQLAQLPTIIGIKEASGQMDTVSLIRSLTPPEFVIYAGDDSLTLPMLALGAKGVVSVASHLVGKSMQDMICFFERGCIEQAQDIHLKLFPLFKALFLDTNPVPIKYALSLQGWKVGSVRSPLSPLSPPVKEQIQKVLVEVLPESHSLLKGNE
jgi:4-hydroxy-tetrahydrodipicolinate synthase